MAKANKSTSRSIFLDTTSAQSAVDNLAKKVAKLDKTLEETNLSQKKRDELSKQRADAETKRLQILDQINKGLGATYNQQSRYIRDLQRDIKNIAVGTEEWKNKAMELKKANAVFDDMKKKLGMVQSAQDKAGGGWGKMAKGLAGIGVAAVSITAVTGFLQDAIAEAEQAEMRLSKLRNILSNLGREDAFDRIAESAQAMADKFQYLDNDDVIGVFDQMITYGKLTENQINELLPVIIDFSAKSGISLEESASVIIKALEGNSRALKEYGIDVSAGSSVTENLSNIMTQLKPRVEGAADAFGNTMAGKAAIARQNVADLKEEIGNKLVPVMNVLYTIASKAMSVVNAAIEGAGYWAELFEKGPARFIGGITADALSKNRKEFIDKQAKSLVDILDTEEKKKKGILQLNKQLENAEKNLASAQTSKNKSEITRWEEVIDIRKKALGMLAPDAGKVLGLGGDMGGKDDSEKLKRELEAAQKDLERLIADVDKSIDKSTLTETFFRIKEIDQEAQKRLKEAAELAIKTGMGTVELKALQDKILIAKREALADLLAAAPVAMPVEFVIPEPSPEDTSKLFADGQKMLDKLNRNTKAGLELDTLTGTGATRLKAKQDLLELEKQRELENKDLSENEKLLIEEKYRKKSADLSDEFRQQELAKVQEWLGHLSQAINILEQFNQARNARENAQFEKEKKQNELRKTAVQKLVQNRVITETEGKKRIAELEASEEKKKEALEKKQAERNKRFAIANTLMNAAQGAIGLWAKPGFPANIPLLAILAAQTAAQIAVITSQKFAGGGRVQSLRDGRISTNQNIPTQSNGDNVLATVKTGEVILNKRQQRLLGGDNTFRSIGVPGFAGGGKVLPGYLSRPYQSLDFSGIIRGYATGGLVRNLYDGQEVGVNLNPRQRGQAMAMVNRSSNPAADPMTTQLMEVITKGMQVNQVLAATLASIQQNGIPANVMLNQIEKAEKLKQDIRDEGLFIG